MNSFLRLLCFLVLTGLSGCVTQQKAGMSNQGMSACQMTCVQHYKYCAQHCTNNCLTCSADANDSAAVNYFQYVHEQQIEGAIVTRGLNSYRDPLQCRKVSCNCMSDLLTCKQGCTGVVQKRLRPVPYCT